MRALNDLRMVKAELQRSQDDFGGHKDSALEACDKAMLELEAVMKASQQTSPQPNPQLPGGGTPPPPSVRMAPPAAAPTPAAPPAQPQP
jgi:hypothetical protein